MNFWKSWKPLKNKQQGCKNCIVENRTLKKRLCYYKARTRKLEADKAKKNWVWSFILNWINLKTIKIKNSVIEEGPKQKHLICCIPRLISYAGGSANKIDKVASIVLTQIAGIQVVQLPKCTFVEDMAIKTRRWYSTRLL